MEDRGWKIEDSGSPAMLDQFGFGKLLGVGAVELDDFAAGTADFDLRDAVAGTFEGDAGSGRRVGRGGGGFGRRGRGGEAGGKRHKIGGRGGRRIAVGEERNKIVGHRALTFRLFRLNAEEE